MNFSTSKSKSFWNLFLRHSVYILSCSYLQDIAYLQERPPEVFNKKGVFRNFLKFTGKHLRQSLFFNKVVDLRPVTLLKKRLWHRCFPVNFAKFLRTPSNRTPLGDRFFYLKYILGDAFVGVKFRRLKILSSTKYFVTFNRWEVLTKITVSYF